ncbi:MAG: hypothetical protein M3Z27_04305 [Actinomycetota bacterium]|nr:hypothetical protein [Actinomycetota bacterium]
MTSPTTSKLLLLPEVRAGATGSGSSVRRYRLARLRVDERPPTAEPAFEQVARDEQGG